MSLSRIMSPISYHYKHSEKNLIWDNILTKAAAPVIRAYFIVRRFARMVRTSLIVMIMMMTTTIYFIKCLYMKEIFSVSDDDDDDSNTAAADHTIFFFNIKKNFA